MSENILFYQLFERGTSTYTYLIGDASSREALIIDPVLETAERDLKLIEELGLKLKYVFDTHIHADHITASSELRTHTGAQCCVSAKAGVSCADILLSEGEEIQIGSVRFQALETPGHTDGCMSLYSPELKSVFTGDALLVRGSGRTDFQQGSPKKLFESVREKLFQLDNKTRVYPGHDYRGFTSSTIGEEKKFNVRLGLDLDFESFCKTMEELKLAPPKFLDVAVPANRVCGRVNTPLTFRPQIVDGVPEITPQILHENLSKAVLVDVRGADEWVGDLGYIPGAILATMGAHLDSFMNKQSKEREIVLICRSGGRSSRMTAEYQSRGYRNVINLQGGMILWNRLGFDVERRGLLKTE